MQKRGREYLHGLLAVEVGRLKHILPEESTVWISKTEDDVKKTTENDVIMLEGWKDEMEKMLRKEGEVGDDIDFRQCSADEGRVFPLDELMDVNGPDIDHLREENKDEHNVNMLNDGQRRAYDIIDWHLQQMLAGSQPPQ